MTIASIQTRDAVTHLSRNSFHAKDGELTLHPVGVIVDWKKGAPRILVPYSNIKFITLADEEDEAE